MPDGLETTLGALVDSGGGLIQTGPFGSQLHAGDYVEDGIPIVMPQQLGDNEIRMDGISRVAEHDRDRLARHVMHKGDIVFSRRGDVTRRAYITEKEDGWLCGTGCLLKHLRRALATFAGTPPGGGGGEIDPARPDAELLADLAEAIAMTRGFLDDGGAPLDDVIRKEGFARNAAIVACKEVANENDETRKRFEVLCREVFKKFKACINVRGVNAHRADRDAIAIIYRSLQQDREQADISDIIRKLHGVVDLAIDLRGASVGRDPAVYDISAIDFERIVAEYNHEKKRVTIERTFEDLLKFVQGLDQEESRAVQEGLDEESLAIFDLLRKADLSGPDIKRIKAVAVDLLHTLKAEKLRVDQWREKEATRDAVKVAIHDFLYSEDTGLPTNAYSDDDVTVRTDEIFRHVFRVYPTLPSPYYETTAA